MSADKLQLLYAENVSAYFILGMERTAILLAFVLYGVIGMCYVLQITSKERLLPFDLKMI